VFERHYCPVHYEVAITLNNPGAIAHRRGECRDGRAPLPPRARDQGGRARAAASRAGDHGTTLGFLYAETRRLHDAELLLRRALTLLEHVLDHAHPSIARCRENLEQISTARNGRS
jgi:hypothetical protein